MPINFTIKDLKPGMVVYTEGERWSPWSALIRWATKSRYTHCFIVTGDDQAVEAYFPRVRTLKVSDRLAELERQGRHAVLADYQGRQFSLPFFEDAARRAVADSALRFVGRYYDVLQAALYFVLGAFVNDGPKRLVCSRVVTAAYYDALDISLFSDIEEIGADMGLAPARIAQLQKGWATPNDLMVFSTLKWLKW